MKPVLTAAQMKQADAYAINSLGIPSAVLMERAALAVCGEAEAFFPFLRDRRCRVLVLCGSGNNGGDGYAAARILTERGHRVSVLYAGREDHRSEENARQAAIWRNVCRTPDAETSLQPASGQETPAAPADAGTSLQPASGQETSAVPADAGEFDLIIDALLGIGLARPVTGRTADLITAVNESGIPVCAVDIPSGLDADTGQVPGCAVKADLTVTFAAYKYGQLAWPGTDLCGALKLAQIGIPVPLPRLTDAFPKDRPEGDACAYGRILPKDRPEGDASAYGSTFALPETGAGAVLEDSDLPDLLPPRSAHSNKGTYGRALLIAGGKGMAGAAVLAGRAAVRSGAGLVTVCSHADNRIILQESVPEAVYLPWGDDEALLENLNRATAAAIGPGLGKTTEARHVLAFVLEHFRGTLIVDADGLNLIAESPRLLENLGDRRLIITPHPGEMDRLLGAFAPELSGEKAADQILSAALAVARAMPAVCLHKDASTVITDGKRVCINRTGCSGMACGGSGDVLTGLLCGLSAQGMPPFAAAAAAAYVHGRAGEAAEQALGARSMTSADIAAHLHCVL